MLTKVTCFLAAAICALPVAFAQRRPVLPQIDLPHSYYYREMYLPQLTSGPSSVAWSPDSQEVVYSMAGSLWRQRVDKTAAVQLTDGPAYDYQPDWSPDGKSVIYVCYQKDAMELWLLDLATGRNQQLTNEGAVNVEPRWSPDGKRIVFVSTAYNKRFHIFRAEVHDGKLENVVRLTGETKSSLPRYYYSAYDMEISPVWMRDGEGVLFVSNRGHIHGTGGLWRMKAQPGAEATEIHYEETNWKARPDFSPDGSRIVYSSYLGREWHQLWVMPATGGDVFALSYGDWDDTNVRWSPDGKRLAFISNRNGNTELWLQNLPGAGQRKLGITERKYLKPRVSAHFQWHDAAGRPLAARVSITDANGRFYAPDTAWIHADDGFDRRERSFEAHYFHAQGEVAVELPSGKIEVEMLKGFEQPILRTSINLEAGGEYRSNTIFPSYKWTGLSDANWISSDLHVHMNYGGMYRNRPAHLVEQAEAENLSIVNNLIVNKEQRFPDITYSGRQIDPASKADTVIVHGQEYHTSYWGHRGVLFLRGDVLLPGYAGYPNTAAASLYPMNADVYDLAHAEGALVGAVHPFEAAPDPFANPPQSISDELPIDAALGKLDYMEIVGFSDHRATASVWYRLLNLGFRIPAGAGTDAMANFASLRGPLGMNRVYLRLPNPDVNVEAALQALKNGASVATNGPLLDFSLGGQEIGGQLNLDKPRTVLFRAKLRSIVPLDHFEVVCNGQVMEKLSVPSREHDNFIFLVPGVTGGGFSHRINGGVDQQTEVMFNGVPEAFSETAGFTFWNQPPYDSIKDADVLTGTFSAQYGLGQGVEQYHTKSGTNTIHGDAFFLYRDDKYLAAPGAFLDINPNNRGVIDQPNTNIQSDWGVSVGGPVYIPKLYNGKNKTFWFFSYDRYRQAFSPNAINLPTAAELSGDFSALTNPSTGAPVPIFVPNAWATNASLIPSGCAIPGFATPQAAAGKQFPGNKIPTSCFSSTSAGLLKQFPIPSPTNSSEVQNFVPTTTALNLQTDVSVNIDHNLTSKQAIHGLFWRQKFPQPNGTDWVASPLSGQQITTILGRGLDITYSNALSSRMVLTGGFLYVYQGNDFLPTHLLPSPLPFAPASGLAGQPNAFPSINFVGGPWEPINWGPGNGLSSTINHKTGYTALANLLWVHGRHNMNIGVDIRKTHQDDFEAGGSTGQPGASGVLNFSSDITANPNEQVTVCGPPSPTNKCVSTPGTNSGNGFASFLLGNVTSAGRGGAGDTNLRNWYVAPYFQDDMQISPRLKVNWGIRWDLAFPFTNDFNTNQLTFFNPNATNASEINPKTGQPLLGAMAELGTCSACIGFSHLDMDWHHFSPRIGATYQLNSKTVLLGGMSWYWLDTGAFEYGVNKVAVNYGNNLNGVVAIGQPGPQIPGFGQWDSNSLPPLPATGFSPGFFNGTSITGGAQVHELPRQVNQAYDEQFVLGIQRELPFNMFLSVSGVHTHDIHLPATLQSAQQSLPYSFVQATCPQGPTVTDTNDCVLASAWTSPAAQGFLATQGKFGQFTYAPGTCGGNAAPVTYYTPYNNFCTEQGTQTPLFVTQVPYPQMPFVTNNFDTSGSDKYNALQVSLQKRTGGGLTYLVSYTLSRYLTNTDSGFSTFNFRGINPANPRAEWSVGNNDQTHVLTIAGVYELPLGPGKKFLNRGGTAMRNIAGGWKISMVDYYESGVPLQTFACGNQFNCDPLIGNIFVGNKPNAVSRNFGVNWNNYYKGTPSINTAAFAFPGSWTLGNGAPLYNTLRAPPYLDEDMALGKRFFFGERFSGELTIQFFNVLNRMLLNNGPNNGAGINCWHSNLTDPNFGKAFNSPTVPCQGNTPRTGQAEFRLYF